MSYNGDVLVLGGIAFTNFSTPNVTGAGGRQGLMLHKLPGGVRVVEGLGPERGGDRVAFDGV
jgi:hypothetical protein